MRMATGDSQGGLTNCEARNGKSSLNKVETKSPSRAVSSRNRMERDHRWSGKKRRRTLGKRETSKGKEAVGCLTRGESSGTWHSRTPHLGSFTGRRAGSTTRGLGGSHIFKA